MTKYYAIYQGSKVVLVFDSESERDDYVRFESTLYPECMGVSETEIQDLIQGKDPVYDAEFGCMVIVA